MRQKLVQFMQGRYGLDAFSNFLMWTACILLFVNLMVHNRIISLLGFALFIYAYVRVFSKNTIRRSEENTWFLNKTYSIRMRARKSREHMRIRKTHHIYRCPECRQKIRIPKGKGKIEITCPKCRCSFVKRS
ncbi:MAG: hypothetical protein ACI4L2_04570 [Wujia sp.]